MLLLIDIGNTNITIAAHSGRGIEKILRIKTRFEAADEKGYPDIIRSFIKENNFNVPEGACVSSVVPDLTPLLSAAVKGCFGIDPLVVSCKIKTGLTFAIENIKGLGADRIANAAAAHTLYPGDIVVVDIGTATTFCVITAGGEYMGGAIMPGPGLSAESLFAGTAQLPKVELRPPDKVIGINTEENIHTGVVIGQAGAVERIIYELKKELNKDLIVVITGGYLDLLKGHIQADYINPVLTLEGLKVIYDLNRRGVLQYAPTSGFPLNRLRE